MAETTKTLNCVLCGDGEVTKALRAENERLRKAAEAFRDAYDAGAEFNETEARNHYRAFSEALEGVKAK